VALGSQKIEMMKGGIQFCMAVGQHNQFNPGMGDNALQPDRRVNEVEGKHT
jgi:hypothetical protein